jgi:hypothetical protein
VREVKQSLLLADEQDTAKSEQSAPAPKSALERLVD